MSQDQDDRRRLIRGLREGDPLIVREFCEQYGPLLMRVADKHLAAGLRRRVGPEDVVQSACRTFVRRAAGGEFRLTDSEGLWRLLCAITLTKVREQARFHLRKKRGLDQEVEPGPLSADSSAPGFTPVARGPTPAEAAEFADEFAQLMSALDEEERRVVDFKLQECTNDEIAEKMGCSERTVRRILKQVQARLAGAFAA